MWTIAVIHMCICFYPIVSHNRNIICFEISVAFSYPCFVVWFSFWLLAEINKCPFRNFSNKKNQVLYSFLRLWLWGKRAHNFFHIFQHVHYVTNWLNFRFSKMISATKSRGTLLCKLSTSKDASGSSKMF